MSLSRPQDFPILVTDAHTTAALACVRSLGEAGYPVHVLSERAHFALAGRSRWAKFRVEGPAYADPSFPEFVERYLTDQQIRLILPTERFLHALGPRLERILPFLHARVSIETLRRSLSKYDLVESFHASGDPALLERLPPHRLVDLSRPIPHAAEFAKLGAPLFLKIDAAPGRAGRVQRVDNAPQAVRALEDLRGSVDKVLVQGFVPGRGVGAFFLVRHGRVVMDFMHERLHEVPHTGGYSSLRRTHYNALILQDAERRAAALGWDGPAMFEYRQDAESGNFWLMELNPRFWGSLHLALFAGRDFPRALADAARGEEPSRRRGPAPSVTARLMIPGEVQYVASRIKDGDVELDAKLASLVEFFHLPFVADMRDDLLYPGDRRVFFFAMLNYAKALAAGLWRRLTGH